MSKTASDRGASDSERHNGITCSELARDADEPIAGTAAWAPAWLLIENRAAWSSHAINDALPVDLRQRIADAGWNAQFVREFDDRRTDDSVGARWRLWFADAHKRTVWLWDCDSADAQHHALNALLSGQPLAARLVDQPFLLVCTNGKRDACCAVMGRSILTGLTAGATHAEPLALESTHLGGHRFAAVVVSLPQSYQYRCTDATHARAIVESARQGLVHPLGLRGHTAKQAPAQVAELAVRERLNLWADSAEMTMDCTVDEGQARVQGAINGAAFDVLLTLRTGEPRRESCSGDPKPLHYWHITDVTFPDSPLSRP